MAPERQTDPDDPDTARGRLTRRLMESGGGRGKISLTMACKKTNKALEKEQEERVLTDIDLERRHTAKEMDRAMRGS